MTPGGIYERSEFAHSFENHLAKYLPVADNIHPNMFGYKAIYEDFYQIIKQDFLTNLK